MSNCRKRSVKERELVLVGGSSFCVGFLFPWKPNQNRPTCEAIGFGSCFEGL